MIGDGLFHGKSIYKWMRTGSLAPFSETTDHIRWDN